MGSVTIEERCFPTITLAGLPLPAKALVTLIIATLGLGMIGALGQVIVHDIIPTFYSGAEETRASSHADMETNDAPAPEGERGDLFAELAVSEKKPKKPFYQKEQFVWTLKWTHIHLFGINMIFIFMGLITVFLNASSKFRTWLVVLPFIGVFIDILAMWLKAFVSPVFFWLHIPGGGLFAIIFTYVALRAIWEMWFKPAESR